MNMLKTPKQQAFTLAELMVGLTLGVMVLAGVLTAYIFFCRTGVAIGQYYDMEDESRTTMQVFGQDVRQAKAINWGGNDSLAHTLTLTLPDDSNVIYAYNVNTKSFRRSKANSGVTLASGIDSFAFKAYSASNLNASTGPTEIGLASDALRTTANTSTNMVRIQIVLRRNAGSQVYSTAQAITAAYVLRNKSGG
jgi:Tfp pilus assembly protein PilW